MKHRRYVIFGGMIGERFFLDKGNAIKQSNFTKSSNIHRLNMIFEFGDAFFEDVRADLNIHDR